MTFMRAVVACDLQAALVQSMTFEEVAAATFKASTRSEWDDELKGFVGGLCNELKGHAVKVVSAKVKQSQHLNADGEKRRRDLDVALVSVTADVEGRIRDLGPPLAFIKTDRGWKFTPKR